MDRQDRQDRLLSRPRARAHDARPLSFLSFLSEMDIDKMIQLLSSGQVGDSCTLAVPQFVFGATSSAIKICPDNARGWHL